MKPKVNLLYLLGFGLLNTVYSIYVVISRPLYGRDVYGEWFVFYLVSAEYIPALFSFFVGALSDVYGRRKILWLSLPGSLLIWLTFTVENWLLKILAVAGYAFMHNIAITIALSSVLEDRVNVGKNYSRVGLASGLGWGVGSTIAWPVFLNTSIQMFAQIVSATYLLGIILVMIGYGGKMRDMAGDLKTGYIETLKRVKWFTPLMLTSYIGLAVGGAFNSLLMDEKISQLRIILSDGVENRYFYGIFYGGLPVLIGAPTRPLIGRLIDKGYAREALATALLSYLALFTVLPFTPPVLFIILWLIPIYPLYDTSLYSIISWKTERFEASASGFVASITSLAGISILILNTVLTIESIEVYMGLIVFMFTLSIVYLLMIRSRLDR